MSQVKLTADSGGGTTSLKGPSATTGNADVVLKLPVADGSSGQVLKTDGSGQLSFTSNAGTTINNNADNRVITGSGTANTLNGESNVVIDSSGNVGIGTTSPESLLSVDGSVAISSNGVAVTPSGYDLKIRSNTSKLGVHTDNASGTPTLEFGTGGATGCFITNLDNTPMRFGTQNTERMRIDGSGRVMIGTSTEGYSGGDDLTIATSADTGITIRTGTTSQGILAFSDGTSGADEYRGYVQYQHQNDVLAFGSNAVQRMTIDSSGKVGIGTTSPTDKLHVAGTTNLAGNSYLTNAYVSGNIYLGGTGSANAFDDYEEGTWTPAVDTTYVSGTPTYHSQTGTYTKIGNRVFINGNCHINSISFSNNNQIFKITGLPFNGATSSGGAAGTTGSTVFQQLEWVGASNSSYGTNNDVVISPAVNSSNKIVFNICSQDKYYVSELKNEGVDGNQALFRFSFFYQTA